jgi:hypothetical protein
MAQTFNTDKALKLAIKESCPDVKMTVDSGWNVICITAEGQTVTWFDRDHTKDTRAAARLDAYQYAVKLQSVIAPAPKAAPRVFGDVVLMLLAYKMGESFSKAQNVAGAMFHGSFNVADKMGYSRDSLEWNGAVNGAMSHIGYCEIHCDNGGLISKIQPKT